VVDPIDGTRAFIAGETGFAHALAVVDRGVVTSAVVFLPMADRMYAASLGGGATLNGTPIRASARAEARGASIFATAAALSADQWPGGLPQLDRHFRAALQHRLCLVADGSFDAALSMRPTWEWDVAAGALIATEAGCAVTGARGETLTFNAPGARCPGVLVAPAALHSALLAGLTG
jgi:myo-inositol-1(or 4)-monophosphatase